MKAQLAIAKTPALGRLHSSLRARFLERDPVIDLLLAAVLARARTPSFSVLPAQGHCAPFHQPPDFAQVKVVALPTRGKPTRR